MSKLSTLRCSACLIIVFFALAAAGQQTDTAKPAQNSKSDSANSPPQFYDPPQFTVSGVIDTTSLGGHGSNATVHTRDSLARDAAGLADAFRGKNSAAPQSPDQLRSERERLQALIANHRDSADTHHKLAEIDEDMGDSLSAVHEFELAAKTDPSERNLFDWGSELLVHHAPEPAAAIFARGSQAFPKSERMLIALGAAYLARGSMDQAVRFIAAASDLNPGDPTPYLFLGRIQSMEKTTDQEIIAKLKRFFALKPDNAAANYYYAVGVQNHCANTQDSDCFAQVEQLLNNAIHLDPKVSAAYLQLGILHADRHNFQAAIRDYRKAIEIAATTNVSSDAHSLSNQILPNPGDVTEEAHFRMAQAYRQIGDAEAARAELEIYERMSRNSQEETERERHEVQQFVYTLSDGSKTPSPQ